jgi:hypothetical protein
MAFRNYETLQINRKSPGELPTHVNREVLLYSLLNSLGAIVMSYGTGNSFLNMERSETKYSGWRPLASTHISSSGLKWTNQTSFWHDIAVKLSLCSIRSRDSAVGIATGYGLDARGFGVRSR